MQVELLFAIIVVFGLCIIFCRVIYLDLFVPAKIDREIGKGNYLKAFDYCYMIKNNSKLEEIYGLIESDYNSLVKKVRSRRANRKDLKRIINYFPAMDVKYDLFLRTVELLFEMEDERLINKLINSTKKPAWEKILTKDLKRLKNAE